MLDHILQCVHAFEREHSTSPDVVYINPFHYAALRRYSAVMLPEPACGCRHGTAARPNQYLIRV